MAIISSDDSINTTKARTTPYLAVIAVLLISFADGVEMYIPSVITQPVSCELNLSKEKEQLLSVSLYVCLGLFSLGAARLSDTIGRRPVLLLSLYASISVTVLCAIVPNYTSLLISRILLGVALALNFSTSTVYFVELSPSSGFYNMGITIFSVLYSLGGGWCGAVAYLFLELLGWRWFVLITSVPVFIPPLILIQFFLPETVVRDRQEGIEETNIICGNPSQAPPLMAVIRRFVLLSLKVVVHDTPYYGAILLAPSIMKSFNLLERIDVPCGAIHGSQFLIITALFGACHVIGRLLGYLSRRVASSATILTVNAVCCLPWIAATNVCLDNSMVLFLGLGALQLHCSAAENETYLMGHDNDFFTSQYLGVSVGIIVCTNALIIPISNIISELFPYPTVLLVHAGCFAANFIVSLLFYCDK